MLSKEYRLKNKFDFKKIYKYGKTVVNPYMVMYFLVKSSIEEECPRVGFSVSKKLGNAVKRNKIKRRMRETVKAYLPLITIDADIIFIARKRIIGIAFIDIEKNMFKLFKKASLI